MRKLLAVLICGLFCSTTFADTCPTVKDIKANNFAGWTAYDSEDGKAFPSDKIQALAAAIDQFALAEWVKEGKAGAIHCYYRDKHGSDLEAYFSKDHINLSENKQAWYEVTGYMHCAAGTDKCDFQSTNAAPALAKNDAAKIKQETPAS